MNRLKSLPPLAILLAVLIGLAAPSSARAAAKPNDGRPNILFWAMDFLALLSR